MAACNHQGTGMTFPKEVNATPKGVPNIPPTPLEVEYFIIGR